MKIFRKIPLCPVCGKPVKIGKRGFWKYCSISCGTKAQRANKELEQKYKETCLKKYGTDNPAKAKNVIEKAKQTCQLKYGGNSPMHSNIVKGKYNLKEINTKRNKTKKDNNTFNTSHSENISYKILKEKFSDTIPQYSSDQYPFNCDFYIPSLDLYIECNYHWTHGGKPYDKLKDKEKLSEWEEKSQSSKFYKNAIETWTERDINKRNIAKKNNLNYIEFWNINELIIWVENYNI